MKAVLALVIAGSSLVSAGTFYVTVGGLGGAEEYATRFEEQVKEIDKLARSAPDATVTTLNGVAATKPAVRKAIDDAARAAKPEDTLVVTYIGHGNFDGQDFKFNISGPDISAAELGEWLDRVPAMKQVVINTASSSGASIDVLRREHRVIVAATKSGTERLATQFARYWVEAMRNPEADADKNEAISVLEAYRYADQKTANFYETQKRLATEHAMLEDTGKGSGVRAPAPGNGYGLLAGQTTLVRFGSLQQAAKSPEKQALLKKREETEARIEKLKYEKAAMDVGAYRKQLGALLLELARLQEELDK